jgi:polar amino acid transport system substrate-binding protein
VTAAVEALRDNGTLAEIEAEWLADAADAPVLK